MTNEEKNNQIDEAKAKDFLVELYHNSSLAIKTFEQDLEEGEVNLTLGLVEREDGDVSTFEYLNTLTDMGTLALIDELLKDKETPEEADE